MKTKIYLILNLFMFLLLAKSVKAQDNTWIDLDGDNDYLSLGANNFLEGKDKFTVEMRVHFDDKYQSCTLLGQRTSDDNRTIVIQTDGTNIFILFNGFNYAYSNFSPDINTYYQITVIYDGTQYDNYSRLYLYINGDYMPLDFIGTIPTSTLVTVPSANLVLGCEDNLGTTSQHFDGQIGEFAVWNYALEYYEIQDRVNNEVLPTAENVIEFYHFDDGIADGDNTSINSITGGMSMSSITPVNMNLNGYSSNFTNLAAGVNPPCMASNAYIVNPYSETEVCNNYIYLSAGTVMNGTGTWSQTEGSGNIAYPYSMNSDVTNLSSGFNTFRWTVSDGICSNYDEVTILNSTVYANAGGPYGGTNSCQQYITLNAQDPYPGTGFWYISSSDPNDANVWIENPYQYNTSIRTFSGGNSADNNFELIWSVNNGQCNAQQSVNIENYAIAYAGSNLTQIGSPIFSLNAMPISNSNSGTYGYWTNPAGTEIYSGQDYWSTAQYLVTNSTIEGTYPLIWNFEYKDGAFTCISKDTMNINIVTDISTANITAGANQSICGFETVINDATDPAVVGLNTTGYWSGTGSVSFNPINSHITTVSNLQQGDNYLTWTITNGASQTYAMVTVYSQGVFAVANNLNGCTPDFVLEANDPSFFGGTGMWTKVGGYGTIENINLYNSLLHGVNSGTSTLIWTVETASCSDTQVITVTNNAFPISAGNDVIVCTDNYLMVAQSPSPGTGYWEMITPTGNFDNIYDNNSYIRNLMSGDNLYAWHIYKNGCDMSDTITITNSQTSIPKINTINNYETCNGTISLQADPGQEIGTWSGPGNLTNVTSGYANSIDLNSGNNLFRWTIYNANCSDFREVNIINNQVVSIAEADKFACSNVVNIEAVDPLTTFYGGYGYWTNYGSETTFITDINSPITTVTNLQLGQNYFQWNVEKGTCFASDEVIVNFNPITAYAGEDQQTCDNFYGPLNGNDVSANNATGLWTSTGTATFGNPSQFNTNVNNLQSGVNVLRWTVTTLDGCTTFDEVNIFNNGVTSNAGTDFETCNSSINLGSIAPAFGTGTWQLEGGNPVTIVNPTLATTQVTSLNAGVYTFIWTVVNGLCSAEDLVVVTNSTPSTSNPTTPNPEVCNSNGTLNANAPSAGEIGLWTGTGTIALATANNTTVSAMPLGVNTYTWTLTKGTYVTCTSSGSVTITNNKVVANAGADKTTLCTNTVTLSGNNPSLTQGTGFWTDQDVTTASISNNTLFNTSVSNVRIGTTTFKWTVSKGICAANDDVIITNNQITSSAGSSQSTCENYYTPLDGNDVSTVGGTGLWTATGTATFVNPNQYNTKVNNLQSGINVLRWTVTSAVENCTAFSEVSIINEGVTADAGTDIETCDATINLSSIAPSLGTGTWTLEGGNPVTIETPSSNTSLVTGLTGGVYSFKWIVLNGLCSASDLVVVTNSTPSISNPTTPTPEVCNSTGMLNANAPSAGETGLWTGTGIIQNQTLNNTTVIDLPLGINTFTWTLTKGVFVTCSSSNSTTITNNHVVATASNQTLNSSEFTLDGNNPFVYGGNGLWEIISGSGLLYSPTMNNSIIGNVPLESTTYLRWNVYNQNCSDYTDISVTNSSSVTATASNQVTCDGTATLDGNDPSIFGGSGLWTNIGGIGILVSPTQYNTQIIDIPNGISTTLRWEIISGGSSGFKDITVTNNNFSLSAGPNLTYCADTAKLNAQNPLPGIGYWSVISGFGNFDDNTNPTTIVRNLGYGDNILNWTVTKNGCSAESQVTITNSSPSPAFIYTASNTETCDGIINLVAQVPIYGVGSWQQISGSGMIGIQSNNSMSVSNLSTGNNIFKWNVQNNACFAYAEITIINNQVESNAGSNQTICENFTNLNAVNPLFVFPNQGSGSWSTSNPGVLITNPLQNGTSVTNLQTGSNLFDWTVTLGNCSATSSVVISQVYLNATATNQTGCWSDFTLDGNNPATFGGTGEWTIISGTGTIETPSIYNTMIRNVADETTTTLRWTVTNGVCSNLIDITITNNSFTTFAGNNLNICGNSIQLDALNPSPGIGNWSISQGSGSFDNQNVNNTYIRNLGYGANVLKWTVYKNDCSAESLVTITNSSPSPAFIFTASNTETCDGTITLEAEIPIYGIGSWQQMSGSGMIGVQTLTSVFVTNLAQAENAFRWVIENGNCFNYQDVTIINNQVASDAGPNQTICENFTNLEAINPSTVFPNQGTGSWSTSNPGVLITNPLQNSTLVTNLQTGNNLFDWTVQLGNCSATSIVTIHSNPLTVSANAGSDKYICQNSTFLEGNDPAPYSGLWSYVNGFGTGTVTDQSQYNSELTNISFGENKLVWTITDGLCISRDTVQITYTNLPIVDAGTNTTFWSNVTPTPFVGYQLNATPVSYPFIGTWSSNNQNDIFVTPTLHNTNANNLHPGLHHFTWTVSAGECLASDQVNIMARISIINAGNKGTWTSSSSWIPQMIPTEYDSVTVTNGTIDLLGDSAHANVLVVKNSGTVNIKGTLGRSQAVLSIGDLFVFEDVVKSAKGNSNVNVNSGGRVNIEQSIDRASRGAKGSANVNSGGRVNIEQGIDKIGGSPVFSVAGQIVVDVTNTNLSDPTASIFIGDNAEVTILDNPLLRTGDRLILRDGATLTINQASESVNPALSIVGGGNVIVENTTLTRAGTASTLNISGGRVNIEQSIDKGVNGAVNVNSGGRVNIEQGIDKSGLPSYLSVPQLNITDGNVIVGNLSGTSTTTSTLNCGYISIIQNTTNQTGTPNFVVGSGGVIDLIQIPTLGNTSYVSVGDSGSITFLYNAQITTSNPDLTVIAIQGGGSVIDSTLIGNVVTGTIEIITNINEGNQLFSAPLSGIVSDNFLNGDVYNWSENQHQFNILTSGTELTALQGYKIDNSVQSSETFTGVANSIPLSINLTNSGLTNPNQFGWNLVGNPFTSALDWESLTLTGIENTVYRYNTVTQNYSIYQQGGLSLNGGNQLISMTEGFFVKMNPALSSTSFNFGEGKVHNIQGLLKLQEAKSKLTTDNIILTVSNGTNSDQTMLGIESGSELNFESNKDIFKLLADVPQLYTKSSANENLALNIFDIQPEEYVVVPLNFKSQIGGSFTISAENLISIENLKISLHDLVTDELTDLTTENSYQFSFGTGENEQRFEIIFDYITINVEELISEKDKPVIYSSEDNVYIKTFENTNYKMEVYSITGSKIYETKFSGKGIYSYQINTVQGFYFVKLTSDNMIINKKVFIN